jgi:hypothetical protein
VFDVKTCSLLIFGGWANRWLGDTIKLNVSPIIGPPYACTAIEPESGPVFGSTQLYIKGLRFKEGTIKVKFGTRCVHPARDRGGLLGSQGKRGEGKQAAGQDQCGHTAGRQGCMLGVLTGLTEELHALESMLQRKQHEGQPAEVPLPPCTPSSC